MTKTNAVRMLETSGIRHIVQEYDVSDGKIDGVSVAHKIGRDPGQVFKTLVAAGKNTGANVFIIPVGFELDLKKAAVAAGDKHIDMIRARDLEPLTGYVHGGCSPVGMKKPLPAFIEETAMLYETIIVSAGRVGLQMELSPTDLAIAAGAAFRDLI